MISLCQYQTFMEAFKYCSPRATSAACSYPIDKEEPIPPRIWLLSSCCYLSHRIIIHIHTCSKAKLVKHLYFEQPNNSNKMSKNHCDIATSRYGVNVIVKWKYFLSKCWENWDQNQKLANIKEFGQTKKYWPIFHNKDICFYDLWSIFA